MDNVIEIERRFLLKDLPSDIVMMSESIVEVKQGYINSETISERFSKRKFLKSIKHAVGSKRYSRTAKIGHGIERFEFKDNITKELFQLVWPLTKDNRVHKTRHLIPVYDPNHTLSWEIDTYHDRDLFICEMEIPSTDFQMVFPKWLEKLIIKEITEDKSYEGRALGR